MSGEFEYMDPVTAAALMAVNQFPVSMEHKIEALESAKQMVLAAQEVEAIADAS